MVVNFTDMKKLIYRTMKLKFDDWLEIDETEVTENLFEYIEEFTDGYQEAYNKIYKPKRLIGLGKYRLAVRMAVYLKSKGIGSKLALNYLMGDIEDWLENKKEI